MSASRANCGEVKGCGREPGGARAAELGVCAAASDAASDGLNGGSKGGRICWAVAGTLCGGQVQGTQAQKQATCMTCDFYKRVQEEQGLLAFELLKPGQQYRTRR